MPKIKFHTFYRSAVAFTVLLLLSCTTLSTVLAQDCRNGLFTFTFTGRWDPTHEPITLDENGYQDIQNMRRYGNSLRGVRGHTNLTTSPFNSTYICPNTIYHYKLPYPSQDWVLVHGYYSTDGCSSITQDGRWYAGSTTPPGSITFGSHVFSDTSGAVNPMFVQAPDGVIVYCNSEETKIWGGTEVPIVRSFLTAYSSAENSRKVEWIEQVNDATTGDSSSAVIDGTYGRVFYVGSPYKLSSLKFYIQTANTTSSTLTAEYFNGSSWVSDTISDGTSSGGIALAQTGSVTLLETSSSSPLYVHDYVYHWHRFTLSGGDASIYYVTGQVVIQDPVNVWDGEYIPVGAAYTLVASDPEDYTIYAQSEDELTTWPWDSLSSTNEVAFGFTQPVIGIYTRMYPGKGNSTSVTGELHVRLDGGSWSAITAYGALIESPAANSSGITYWPAIDTESERPLTQMAFGSVIVETDPMYFYRYGTTSGTMDSEVEAYYVSGIPKTEDIGDYAIPVVFKNRLFLLNEIDGARNSAIYSAYGTSYVFNGSESGSLIFGDMEEITGAGVVFNVFRGESYEQLIVLKQEEAYRVVTDSITGLFKVEKISGTSGCVSPRSVATCSVTGSQSTDSRKQVLLWVSSSGVMASDGSSVWSVSDDISQYWDTDDSAYIDPSDLALSVGVYDPNLNVYKLLVDDLELEYSLKYMEWTKINRVNSSGSNQLKAACPVTDSDGKVYIYGVTNSGIVYKTESGSYWTSDGDSQGISQYVWTKDIMLDNCAPLFNSTYINTLRLLYDLDPADPAANNAITFDHYCDGTATTDGSNEQTEPPAIDKGEPGPFYTTDVGLGRCKYHSFKISYPDSSGDDDERLSLFGMGLVFDTFDVMDVD